MNSLIYMHTGKDLGTLLKKIISIACDRTKMDIYYLDQKIKVLYLLPYISTMVKFLHTFGCNVHK